MGLNYNPKDASNCWPVMDGGKPIDYDAELTKVVESESKTSGNPMEVWTWKVFGPDGRSQLIDDYVVIPAAVWKIKQLAKALGKEAEFTAAKFHAEDYIGSSVVVELGIESQQGYDDKNKIGKLKTKASAGNQPYPRTRESVSSRPAVPAGTPFESGETQFKDDDVPFAWQGRVGQPL